MNATTLAYIEQAIIDSEPESPVFTSECKAIVEPFGNRDHYYCDPTKCIDAAYEVAYEDSLYRDDVECTTCNGRCELS